MRPKQEGCGTNRPPLGSDYVNGNEMDGLIIQKVRPEVLKLSKSPSLSPSFPSILSLCFEVERELTCWLIGIWLSPQGPSSSPFFTFVGSSNLSNRSLKYDTELSLLLMTSSPSLRKALAQEVQNLNMNARDVGEETWKLEERRVSWFAWLLIKIGVEGYL